VSLISRYIAGSHAPKVYPGTEYKTYVLIYSYSFIGSLVSRLESELKKSLNAVLVNIKERPGELETVIFMHEVIALKQSFMRLSQAEKQLIFIEQESNKCLEKSFKKMAEFLFETYTCVQRLQEVDKLYSFPYSSFGEILKWSISKTIRNRDQEELAVLSDDVAADIATNVISYLGDQITRSLLKMDRGPFLCSIHILKDLYFGNQNQEFIKFFKGVAAKLSKLQAQEHQSILSWLRTEASGFPIKESTRDSIILLCDRKADRITILKELIDARSDPVAVTLVHTFVFIFNELRLLSSDDLHQASNMLIKPKYDNSLDLSIESEEEFEPTTLVSLMITYAAQRSLRIITGRIHSSDQSVKISIFGDNDKFGTIQMSN
jgi:hypothetical protein